MSRMVLRSLAIAGCLVFAATFAAGDDDDGGRRRGTYQTANMFRAGNPAMKRGGAATLYRFRQRLEMRVATSGLDENSAYTVWWVVFNNPEACIGGCGPDDLANPAVNAAVFYAAGFVTGGDGMGTTEDGTANVSAYVNAGALPEGVEVVPEATGDRLERGNGFAAEVHIVVRSHGTVNRGHVHEQIGSFNGGCNPGCANQQAAIFMPVQ
jgi:hypothetical protein